MQTTEFIDRVANSGARETARQATFVSLECLGEHLPAEESRRLAAQLPAELGEAVTAGGARGDKSREPIALADFYAKVAERAGLEDASARDYAHAVGRTLRVAVSPGESSDVALELPGELAELLR